MRQRWIRFAMTGMVLLLTVMPGFSAVRALPGFSTSTLPANDDGSTGAVAISFAINLFGTTYTTLYVNNNGNVTFDSPLGTYTPFGLTTTATKIIAPFFADVDTNGAGSGLVKYGTDTVDGHPAFGVEWPAVGYYGGHVDKKNTFELVIINRSDVGAGNFDFEFNYDSIQWETGDASGGSGGLGGSSARAGYSNGLTGGANVSFELTGSATNGAFLNGGPNALPTHSLNSAVAGRYLFSTRGGVIGGTPTAIPAISTLVLILMGVLLLGIMWFLRARTA